MDQVEKLYTQLTRLADTSSRLEKEAILREYANDTTFTTVLKFLLDNLVTTGISKKKINKDVRICYYEAGSGDYCVEDLLDYFKTHKTGTDDDIAFIQFYIEHLTDDEDYQEFLKSIVTKSLRLGVDVTTCQKIYGKDFIQTLDVMLGTSIENCTIPDNAKIFISQKLNGNRCFYYRDKLYTRQGKEYIGCDHILKDLEKLESAFKMGNSTVDSCVFDGELILEEQGLSDSEAFQKGTGIATSKDKDKSSLKLVIFDTLTTQEFENGVSDLTYEYRRQWLDSYAEIIANLCLKNITIVPRFYAGYDHSEIWKWLEYAESRDMEGIMINLDTPYECKRTKNLIKVKKFYTYDLRVTGVEEGTGRNSGKLGAVIVDFRGNNVRVGSGFNDDQRVNYWQHPELIIGRVIEVKYKEVTRNKQGTESLQFPVFIRVREEGKDVSYD